MNPNLRYERNTVYWMPVLGVDQYQVRVNGVNIVNVGAVCSAPVVLTREGENTIEVRYVSGENASDWVGVTVMAYAVEYDTRSVAYGAFFVEYLAVGDRMSLPEMISPAGTMRPRALPVTASGIPKVRPSPAMPTRWCMPIGRPRITISC